MRNRLSNNWAIIVLLATSILFLSTSLAYAMTDVTDKVQLEYSKWRMDARRKIKCVDVSLKNISQDDLWTPIIKVVIDGLSDSRVTVTNEDGTTDYSKPYFEYSASGQLGTGESTDSKEWVFSYPKNKVMFGHKLGITASVWGCTDADSDGYYLEEDCGTTADCNDSDILINSSATEVCDEQDNNCDGQIDEGVTTSYYRDADNDTHGNFDNAIQACSEPDGYVPDGDDCDDDDENWWLGNDQGDCVLTGYTDCDYPWGMYEKHCHPPVTDVEIKLENLHEDKGIDFDKDIFAWHYYRRPGEAQSESQKTHLQNIQYTELKYPDEYERETVRSLVVAMSDETHNQPTISVVHINHFASEVHDDDRVISQSDLTSYSDTQDYNHAGGAQLIGEYFFVALEDFNGEQSDPKTGVWKIERDRMPFPAYQYSFVVNTGDAHHTAVGVTKLKDETYLVAACVVKGCDTIRFFKSTGTSLEPEYDSVANKMVHPEFNLVDEWKKPDLLEWANCGDPQNINMVVDANGDIYIVMFGMQEVGSKSDLGIPCGTGEHDDHIYGYKLSMTDDNQTNEYDITLINTNKVDIDAGGNNCDCVTPYLDWPPIAMCNHCEATCVIPVAATGTNFMAGSGLWIRPNGKDDIAILDTEHYDSCYMDPQNGDGLSRWGVTENWRD